MAHDSPPSRTRADRHIQSLLLRGSADRSGASGDSPQPGAFRRVARGKTIWEERYRSIVDLESHLYRNGTRTIKVFLHLSQEEQRKRFLGRIDEPDKNWKFSLSDIHERKYWKHYMEAYEACLNATSTHHAPWYVVPADDKENARLIVSQIVLDALNELKMAYPKTTAKRRRELNSIRTLLAK
jgi:hypothetical protein